MFELILGECLPVGSGCDLQNSDLSDLDPAENVPDPQPWVPTKCTAGPGNGSGNGTVSCNVRWYRTYSINMLVLISFLFFSHYIYFDNF